MVRLEGVLTSAERHLVKSVSPEKGRGLLKQVRTELIETIAVRLTGNLANEPARALLVSATLGVLQ